MAAAHPTLPRGARVEVGDPGHARQILVGPAHDERRRMNLLGALRRAMATVRPRHPVKELQKAEVMVAPALLTEGKQLQRDQHVGMGR